MIPFSTFSENGLSKGAWTCQLTAAMIVTISLIILRSEHAQAKDISEDIVALSFKGSEDLNNRVFGLKL